MVKLHFQVVVLDLQDYILEHKNFQRTEIKEMVEYIKDKIIDDAQTVKISRWDENNNRV